MKMVIHKLLSIYIMAIIHHICRVEKSYGSLLVNWKGRNIIQYIATNWAIIKSLFSSMA